MPTFVFDEERVDLLAQRFQIGGDDADELAVLVNRRIDEIGGLEQPKNVPIGLVGFGGGGAVSLPNDFLVAKALQDANLNLDGLAVAVRTLESLSGVWREASAQLVQRIADIQAATITVDELADGDLLADIRAERPEDVIRLSGVSIRAAIPDLPVPGEDPELDAAIARFDSSLLPRILSGELDASDLSEQERDDLQHITDLLGGGDVVAFTRERRDFVEVGGEDQAITVTTEVLVSDAGAEAQAAFVGNTVIQRSAANTVAAAAADDIDFEVSTERGEGGREGGESQSSVSGEATFGDGTSFSTETVDLGDGLERVTVTDSATGTQFSGVRAELEGGGYGVSGDITFPDGSTGAVTVTNVDDRVQISIESEDLVDGESSLTRDLNRTAPEGFGIIDSLVDLFENFSPFSTDPDPIQGVDLTDSGGGDDDGGRGYDDGWNGGYGTENDGDYDNNYSGI